MRDASYVAQWKLGLLLGVDHDVLYFGKLIDRFQDDILIRDSRHGDIADTVEVSLERGRPSASTTHELDDGASGHCDWVRICPWYCTPQH